MVYTWLQLSFFLRTQIVQIIWEYSTDYWSLIYIKISPTYYKSKNITWKFVCAHTHQGAENYKRSWDVINLSLFLPSSILHFPWQFNMKSSWVDYATICIPKDQYPFNLTNFTNRVFIVPPLLLNTSSIYPRFTALSMAVFFIHSLSSQL